MTASTRITGPADAVICPICQTAIAPAEAVVTCTECDQVHHQDCWTEIGGCATYGCKQAPAVDKTDQVAPDRRSAWGDMKKCPACGEIIKAIALRCRYCRTDFDTVDPLTTADLRRQAVTGDRVAGMKRNVCILFGVSLIGILAPLCLLAGLAYLLPKRELLAKCGMLFVILGWTGVVLSGLYSLLLLAFFAFG